MNSALLTHSRRHILDSSKSKEFADDNFKFDENGGKLSKQIENTVGKGEIARYEQFLLFPQCFQKARFPGASKGVIVWEWVKELQEQIYNDFFQQPRKLILMSIKWVTEALFPPYCITDRNFI